MPPDFSFFSNVHHCGLSTTTGLSYISPKRKRDATNKSDLFATKAIGWEGLLS